MSVAGEFFIGLLRPPFGWPGVVTEIGAARHNCKRRFPNQIEACFLSFAPDCFAIHRSWAEDDSVIGEEGKERRPGALFLAGLVEFSFRVDHRAHCLCRSFGGKKSNRERKPRQEEQCTRLHGSSVRTTRPNAKNH